MTQIDLNDFLISSFQQFTTYHQHTADITSIDYSPNGNLIITGGNDDLISLYSLQENETKLNMYINFYGVKSVCFTPEKSKILCAARLDHRIMIINMVKKEIEFSFFGHNKPIDAIDFCNHNGFFISNSIEEQTSIIWDYNKRSCVLLLKNSLYACIDYYGEFIVSYGLLPQGNAAKLNVYRKNTFKFFTTPTKNHMVENKIIKRMKITNSGEYAVCFNMNEINIYDLMTGQCVLSNKNDDVGYRCFDISPDSKYFAAIDYDDCLWIFNFKNEAIKKDKKIPQKSQVIKFSSVYCLLGIGNEEVALLSPDMTKK